MTFVLVVKDEESISDALSYLMRKEGFEVAVCPTGPDALEAFDRDGADLVLLDLMLPGPAGTEVCRSLRQRSDVPVIMLTAKDTEVDRAAGLGLGADDYVTKPLTWHELLADPGRAPQLAAAHGPASWGSWRADYPPFTPLGGMKLTPARGGMVDGGRRPMGQTVRFQEALRRLAMIDEGFVEDEARLGLAAASALDPMTTALLHVGVPAAIGSPAVCLEWSACRALAAGASEDEIAGVLLAIGPVAGLGRVVAAAAEAAIALGYDIAAALEGPDGY